MGLRRMWRRCGGASETPGQHPRGFAAKCQISGGAKTDEARRREHGGGARQAGDPQGGARNRGTGSDIIDYIPGRRNSGNHIPGMPVLARIHYNLPYKKY